MKTPMTGIKAPITLLLAFAIGTLLVSPVVIARVDEPDPGTLAETLPVVQAPTGMLTVHGPVLLNGNEAKTGMTVLDGSLIQTRTAGEAIIEMGALGQVIVHGFTAITLKMSPNRVDIDLDKCGKGVTVTVPANVPAEVRVLHEGKVAIFSQDRETDVKVKKGQVLVKYENDKEKTLTAVDHHDFDGAKTVSATGDAVFKVYCDEKEYPIILAVALSALVLPAVVESIGEEFPPPVVSPPQP